MKFLSSIWEIIERVIFKIIMLFSRKFHVEISDEAFGSVMQFIRFGIVGLSNTVVSYVIYVSVLLLLNKIALFDSYNYLVAQVVQFILSVLWSFFWNNKVVFKIGDNAQRNLWLSLLKTYLTYSFTGLFLNSLLLWFWIDVLKISEFIAPLINLIVSVPINFILNKFWAFKDKKIGE